MKLKNIKLAGFKSFVDPTNVQLNTNMVAVIGPNGCGKSNIIDAVRWVMGESSAKNLRGESMADVIFNGSTARKPVGQASIELIFDNSDGTLVGEYAAFSEISIKRKVTRDGQSQYMINGAKCRRRDITDIFLGTGLGPRSYAIIEQGMISRLIESKPEELRVFIEEAAGISKYKERRRETETRIRHSRENLERLTDIREELERQLQRLKRQSAAAEKYKTYKVEERTLRAQTLALQWQSLYDNASDQRKAIQDRELALEAAITEQRTLDSKIETLRQQQHQGNDQFNRVQADYYGIGAEISKRQQALEHHQQREQQLQEDLTEAKRNANEGQQHLEEDNEKLTRWQNELNSISPKKEELSASESASSVALQSAEATMQDWQQRWDIFNEDAAEPQKNAEVQRSKIDQIEQALGGLSARLERMNGELGNLDSTSHKKELSSISASLEEQEGRITKLQQRLSECDATLQDARPKQKQLANELDQMRSQLQQQRGRQASLDALQNAAQADSDGDSKAWLASQNLDSAPRLLETLQVDSGWELAVETVLGDSLQAVSVDKLDSVVSRLDQLGNCNLGFIEPYDAGSPTAEKNGLAALRDKTSASGNLLAGIYAADTLKNALANRSTLAAHESIVTRDGIWLGVNWLKVLRQQDATSGIIERRQMLATLADEIANSERHVETLVSALETAQSALLAAEQDKDRLQIEKGEEEQELSQQRAALSALEAKIEQINTRHKNTKEEIHHAEKNQQQQREELGEARELLDTAIESIQIVEEQRETLLLERDNVRDTLTECRRTAANDRDALQSVAVRNEGLKAKISSVQSSIERLRSQLQQLQQRRLTLHDAQRENQAPVAEIETQLAQQLSSRAESERELGEARKLVESLDAEMRNNEKSRSEQEQKTQLLRATLEKLRIESQEMAVRSKTIEEQLEASGFSRQAVIDALPEEARLADWQTQLTEVALRIERLGAINLAAIEEYQTESERKKHLDAQNEELESALTTLESAIQKIDRETRSLFKETFDKLNGSLKELFPKVFGGGSAYLEMTGEDLLDTGITIMARPPGKRNSTIHLLSGGEKALTAIALVFSIFQLNPAPFCMLDEVDAPLDDANTSRYARMVQEMSKKVQFIFITHNKITMEMADHLMGVTMHEPGCSRLVSVDIDEAVAMAEA